MYNTLNMWFGYKKYLCGWRGRSAVGARQRLWGCRAWISPRRAQGQAAGCQGREHSLSHLCALPGAWTFTCDIFSSWGWAAELRWPRCSGAPRALASCLGAREDPELSVCANPASLGDPRAPICGHRWEWREMELPTPTVSPQLWPWVCPEPTQKAQSQPLLHGLSWTSLAPSALCLIYSCFV